MKSSSFSLIAMHDPPSKEPPYYEFEIIPSIVTSHAAEEAAKNAGLSLSENLGLLVGGDGEGVAWSESDYLSMVDAIIMYARKLGRGIWIASSRRTPPEVEDMMRSRAEESGILSGACWYHSRQAESVSLLAMMGACSNLFVTGDSMSMTHEAVSSGRPVYVLFPLGGGGNPRLMGNLRKMESSGRVVCQSLPDLSFEGVAPDGGWTLEFGDPTSSLAKTVMGLIWN